MNKFDITEQIPSLNKLSFKEAKFLYWKNILTEDEKLKEHNLNNIILGTLYFPNEYINKDELDIILSRRIDTDDVISAVNLIWIEKIKAGILLSARDYNHIFLPVYFNNITELIGVEKVNRTNSLPFPLFNGLYNRYLLKRQNGLELDNDEIKDLLTYKIKSNLLKQIDDNLKPFFDLIYEYKPNKLSYMDSLKYYYYYIWSDFYPSSLETISGYKSDDNMFQENIENKIFYEQFSSNILDLIKDDEQKDIIKYNYGLFDSEQLYQFEINRLTGISIHKISDLEIMTFKKAKKNKKILDFKLV